MKIVPIPTHYAHSKLLHFMAQKQLPHYTKVARELYHKKKIEFHLANHSLEYGCAYFHNIDS